MKMEELATLLSRGRRAATGGAEKEKENCFTQERWFFLVGSRLCANGLAGGGSDFVFARLLGSLIAPAFSLCEGYTLALPACRCDRGSPLMSIVIRPADLRAQRDRLIRFLFENLTPLSDGRRFEWLYCDSPHGPARVWIATDGGAGAIVGAAAAFPRRLCVQGVPTPGCVLGDFCIHPRYRSLGPAVQLQRACLADIDSGTFALGYDFPSTSMVAVYKRLRVELGEQMVRLALPLRADRKIAEKVKVLPVARGLSAAVNLLLRLRGRARPGKNPAEISRQGESWGDEFSLLAKQVSAAYGVCVERSSAYLNWRYLAHPHSRHEMLTARRDGELIAYVIFTQTDQDASIVDLFGFEDTEVLGNLVAHAVDLLRQRGVVTVSAPVLASHPRRALFESLGFHAREAVPVLLYRPGKSLAAANPSWFLMDGDRDS